VNGSSDGLARVFIIGCPRSGTTWLQLLLAQHPSVATARETYVFNRYLAGLERGWEFDSAGGAAAREPVGLVPILAEDEFWSWAQRLPDLVFERLRDGRPDVTTIVEKTPAHTLDWPLILRLYPDAVFLHMIRDPRSVVSSLVRASRTWATNWASQSPVDEARRWKQFVTEGRRIATSTDRYLEVRYEDLLEDTSGTLGGVFEWLQLSHDASLCETAAEACRIDRLRSRESEEVIPWDHPEPDGFFGKGRSDSWREDLTKGQLETVEFLAADLMAELGYERVTDRDSRPLRLWLREGLEWRFRHLFRRLESWLERL